MYFARKPFSRLLPAVWLAAFALLSPALSRAAEVEEVRKLFLKGDYEETIKLATAGVNDSPWDEQGPLLLARAQMATGKYPEAESTIKSALPRYSPGIQTRLLAREVFNANGHTDRADAMLKELATILEN